jgi:hypothetical protein
MMKYCLPISKDEMIVEVAAPDSFDPASELAAFTARQRGRGGELRRPCARGRGATERQSKPVPRPPSDPTEDRWRIAAAAAGGSMAAVRIVRRCGTVA